MYERIMSFFKVMRRSSEPTIENITGNDFP